MYKTLLLWAITLGASAPLRAQTRVEDSLAILEVLQRRERALEKRDAELERSMYAPEAVWFNAFGTRRTGQDSIVAFLKRLYADSGYRQSRTTRADPAELLFIRPDVAVAHTYHELEGQQLADGRTINRRIHTTFVLSRENGHWLVRYQYIADERDRATPARGRP